MRLRTRRVARVLALVPLTALAPALADDEKLPADYRCDLRKALSSDSHHEAKVGEAVSEERDETDSKKIRDLDDKGDELSSDTEETALHVESVKVLVARGAKGETETQVRYAAWRRKKKGAADDTSLEGKVAVVRSSGKRCSFFVVTLEGERAKVSDEALAWLGKEFKTSKVTDEDKKKLDLLAPEKPVAPDTEWTGDPKILSEALFDSVPIDAGSSSVRGKLSKVRVEDGVVLGTVGFQMKIKLERVPNTTIDWTDGGLMEMTVDRDGALDDPACLREDETFVMAIHGKLSIETKDGTHVRDVAGGSTNKRKVRPVKAPEAVKLRFDPEADYRWNLADWAAGEETGATPHVGDRCFIEIESTSKSHVLVNGAKTDKDSALTARVEITVTAVANEKDSERRATVVRWSETQGEDFDDSLEGKTVVLVRAPGAGQPAFRVLDAKGAKCSVSESARKFIETELLRPRTRGLQLDGMQELLGNEPLVPGKEVAIDPAKAVKKLFGANEELDAKTSHASGKLGGVHLVEGDHEGKLEVHLDLRLKTIPGAPGNRFGEPGICDLVFGFEGSLDRSRTGAGTTSVVMDYSGKGTINGKGGSVSFEPHVITKRTIRTGPLPRAEAPADGGKK